jgi:UDP-N-acetylmuramyl pentapeptide phosphotransferase/UDP-N-acetylglucosamine-1-phosphate transferase
MATKKQKVNQRNPLKGYTPIALVGASLVFNTTTLAIIPSHFSVVAVTLLLTSFFALFIVNNSKKLDSTHKGIMFCFAFSLAYLLLVLYWNTAGPSACGEFFGSYRSCLGSAQQVFIEIFATPVILLTATQPIFRQRRI